jgi:hypothetical protein
MDKQALFDLAKRAQALAQKQESRDGNLETLANDLMTFAFINGCGSGAYSHSPEDAHDPEVKGLFSESLFASDNYNLVDSLRSQRDEYAAEVVRLSAANRRLTDVIANALMGAVIFDQRK